MTEENDLFRLTYVSAHDLPIDVDGFNPAFADIETVAIRRNAAAGITGFLICGGNWFAQVLEGPAAAVDGLYARLPRDVRHRDLRLVERSPIACRRFPDWAMALGWLSPANSMIFAVLDFEAMRPPVGSDDERLLDLAADLAAVRRVAT